MKNIVGVPNPYGLIQKAGKKKTYKRKNKKSLVHKKNKRSVTYKYKK